MQHHVQVWQLANEKAVIKRKSSSLAAAGLDIVLFWVRITTTHDSPDNDKQIALNTNSPQHYYAVQFVLVWVINKLSMSISGPLSRGWLSPHVSPGRAIDIWVRGRRAFNCRSGLKTAHFWSPTWQQLVFLTWRFSDYEARYFTISLNKYCTQIGWPLFFLILL